VELVEAMQVEEPRTSSFFFVSTPITGWSSSMDPAAMSLRYRYWASRSACWWPSVTLALACNE